MTKTPDYADMEFRNPAPGDNFYDSTSTSDIGPLMEDPVTPMKTSTDLNEHQLQQLQNESKTTVGQADSPARSVGSPTPFASSPAQFAGSPIPRSSNLPSRRASPPLGLSSDPRAIRVEQAQEQRTVDYLQADSLELAFTRESTHSEPLPESGESGPTRVTRIARMLSGMVQSENGSAPQPDVSDSETRRRSLSRTRRVLYRIKARKLDRRSGADDVIASAATQDLPEPSASFQTRRVREGVNWFSGSRASKTLPHGFEPPAGLQESPRASRSGSLRGQSSRSASLRLRNSRLPLAYALPTEQTLESALVHDREAFDEVLPHSNLDLWSPLHRCPRRELAAPKIPDPDDEGQAISAPLNVPQRPPPSLIIHTVMSGALSGTREGSNCDSRFNEVLEEVDGGARPNVPPKSAARMSARNSALLSDRGSVMFPLPEPAPETIPATPKEKEKASRIGSSIFALVWSIATALTLFGVSTTTPLDRYSPACTLDQVQTCPLPSLSFKHNIRLNTTLPSILRPYLASLHLDDLKDLTLTDRGIEVSAQTPASSLEVRGSLTISTSVADNEISLLSDITYAGVIDGDGDDQKARRKLREVMAQTSLDGDGNLVKVVSALGASRTVSVRRDGASIGKLFFAFWLGCMLAVELTLLYYLVVLPFLGAGVALVGCYWSKQDSGAVKREGVWKQEIMTAFRVASLCVLAGALGTAGASGILIAFWT